MLHSHRPTGPRLETVRHLLHDRRAHRARTVRAGHPEQPLAGEDRRALWQARLAAFTRAGDPGPREH